MSEVTEINIGQILKTTRENKNFDIEDVSAATSIRKLYLVAIEENNFSAIPGEVFTKGIIRTYGNFLGVDGQALVEQYKASTNGYNAALANTIKIREAKKVNLAPTFFSQDNSIFSDKKRIVFIGISITILVCLAFIFFKTKA